MTTCNKGQTCTSAPEPSTAKTCGNCAEATPVERTTWIRCEARSVSINGVYHSDSPAEVHHVRKNGGLRENVDKWTIPLCPYHHRIGPDAVHNARRLVERLHGISEEAMAEETRRDVEEMLNGRDQRNA